MLYDRILARGLRPCGLPDLDQSILLGLRDAVPFDIDSVTPIFFEKEGPATEDSDEWTHQIEDFPNVAPVFPEFWMEFSSDVLKTLFPTAPHASVRMGCLFEYAESEDGWALRATTINADLSGTPNLLMVHLIDLDAKGAITSHKLGFPPKTIWWVQQIAPTGDDPLIEVGPRTHLTARQRQVLNSSSTQVILYPCLFALSLLHCKNVSTTDNTPDSWQQMKFQKRHNRPLVTYKTLNVGPMHRVLREEGNLDTTGLKRALHICRGHFVTYDEKPLFGKVTGTFWKESHVRGSLGEGAVVKNYRVKPAKENA